MQGTKKNTQKKNLITYRKNIIEDDSSFDSDFE